MKIHCSMHDMIYNCSEAKFNQMAEAEIECMCCGRDISGDNLHAFEVPKSVLYNGVPYTTGQLSYCNCFITAFDGRYSKEKIEEYNRGRSFKDIEEMEIEENEQALVERFNEQSLALP